jgi:transcription elongation GreA/GreB family factor
MNRIGVFNAILAALEVQIQQSEKILKNQHRLINATATPSQSHSDTSRFQESEVVAGMTKSSIELCETFHTLNSFRARLGEGVLDRVVMGSVIKVTCPDFEEYYVLLPCGGGMEASVDEVNVCVASPNSPFGKAVCNKKVGDKFCLGDNELTIVQIW